MKCLDLNEIVHLMKAKLMCIECYSIHVVKNYKSLCSRYSSYFWLLILIIRAFFIILSKSFVNTQANQKKL